MFYFHVPEFLLTLFAFTWKQREWLNSDVRCWRKCPAHSVGNADFLSLHICGRLAFQT